MTGGGSGREKSVGQRERERERMFTSGVAPRHFHWGVSSTHGPLWIYRKEEEGGEATASRKGQRESCGDVNCIIWYMHSVVGFNFNSYSRGLLI